jgi:hypothetical protein
MARQQFTSYRKPAKAAMLITAPKRGKLYRHAIIARGLMISSL